MLFVIDVGNSNVVCGLFEGETVRSAVRMETGGISAYQSCFEELNAKFGAAGSSLGKVEAVCMASVVPEAGAVFAELSRRCLGREPVIVSSALRMNIRLGVEAPEKVGADRIANAAAALQYFGAPFIVVDFGTATTLDVVDKNGVFCGGIIAPGLRTASYALSARTALLPEIGIAQPQALIGRNTEEAMLSGIYYGQASMVDGLVERLGLALEGEPLIVATGGFAPVMADLCGCFDEIRPELTLQGLRVLAELNHAG